MLRGLSTIRFQAADLEAAKRWYAELLGIEPYFNRPGYTEFRLGDYQHELGIVDSAYVSVLGGSSSTDGGSEPAGAVVYWHVDDVAATMQRLVELGAKSHEPVRELGNGFVVASAVDPFGNILGIMYNPHYLEVLASTDSR